MNASRSSSRFRIVVIAVVLVALAAIGGWYYFQPALATNGELAASGTIEAAELNINPEVAGRVVAVNVNEGDVVRAGDVLVQFDAALLQAQRTQAAAALAAAAANFASVKDGATAAQLAAAVARAEQDVLAAQQALDGLKDTAALATAQAQSEVARARAALDKAQKNLRNQANPDVSYYQDQYNRAEETLTAAQQNAQITQYQINVRNAADVLTNTTSTLNDLLAIEARYPGYGQLHGDILTKAQKAYDRAVQDYQTALFKLQQAEANDANAITDVQKAVERAKANLDTALAGGDPIKQAQAEADVAVAEAALKLAEENYAKVQSGPDPDKLAAAEARLASAQAGLMAAKAALAPEQLAAAKAQLDAAQAALDLFDVQIKKLTLTAPADGVVLSRAIEPGEVASPGATLLVISPLTDLRVTVYVPEDRYGVIHLGQPAQVAVDSFPGRTFTATVLQIADRAEFTPRNSQTVEGRKDTVFAVRLSIANPDLDLKPGMPADVTFEQD